MGKDTINFSARLRYLRKKQKLTQGDLATLISAKTGELCYRTTVTKWGTGTHEPGAYTMKILAEIFDVTVDYLVGTSYATDAVDLTAALQDKPELKKLVLKLLDADDEKIQALCVIAGVE